MKQELMSKADIEEAKKKRPIIAYEFLAIAPLHVFDAKTPFFFILCVKTQ